MKKIKVCVIAVTLTFGGIWAEVVPTVSKVPVDGASVTNFVNAFFAAYNAKDNASLREMVGDKKKYDRIVRGSKRYGGQLSMSIKDIDLDALKAIVDVRDKKGKSRVIAIEMKSIGGVLKVMNSGSPDVKRRVEELDIAFKVGQDFCVAVRRSDTNSVLRILGAQESVAQKFPFEQLLCDRKVPWVASVMKGGVSMSFRRVKVDGEKILVVFEMKEKGSQNVKYIGYQDGCLTFGIEQ